MLFMVSQFESDEKIKNSKTVFNREIFCQKKDNMNNNY